MTKVHIVFFTVASPYNHGGSTTDDGHLLGSTTSISSVNALITLSGLAVKGSEHRVGPILHQRNVIPPLHVLVCFPLRPSLNCAKDVMQRFTRMYALLSVVDSD